ncbi:MAG: hypothetical protein HY261_09100, partial [Chloroflexi bacterium]|nr:hypothetical protein [Chloroflexota bacterium]
RTPRDFGDVLYSYLAGAAREGAVYVEMFCSPERPAALGLSYSAWLDALEQGIDRARRDFGIEGRIIVIPDHGSQVIVRPLLRKILRDMGLDIEGYHQMLDDL